jgi:hypothetical protein
VHLYLLKDKKTDQPSNLIRKYTPQGCDKVEHVPSNGHECGGNVLGEGLCELRD